MVLQVYVQGCHVAALELVVQLLLYVRTSMLVLLYVARHVAASPAMSQVTIETGRTSICMGPAMSQE